MPTTNRRTRRPPWVWRIIRVRPRLFASSVVGMAAIVVLAALTDWRPVMRGLVGWDIGIGLYVILAFEMMARANVHQIRRRAATQDEGAIVILVLTVATAMASLLAIVALLGTSAVGAAQRRSIELILATITIVLSWATDREAFRGLMRARAIHTLFPNYDDAKALYGMAAEMIGNDPYLLQQEANYERIRPNGNLRLARTLLETAQRKDPDDSTILHTLAEVIRAEAEASTK